MGRYAIISRNAEVNFNYIFKETNGYIFEKGEYVFKEYIDDLFLIKQSHTKNHPMYWLNF